WLLQPTQRSRCLLCRDARSAAPIRSLSLHDALPIFEATVRYIASKAEFTPKEVQTPDERVKLIYAVRLYLKANPNHRLTPGLPADRKSTRLNSSHVKSSYAVFCSKKKASCCGSMAIR